ncbi:uncharacterized protein LOC130992793 [Salvia miltiorrhiza]|uniref:uncharacterized protein LOC130992793 n=1 Tax=Salvia miltiorrhiza TaxID=226208 RepID=UPI0025AB857A|nr:uncharacterized protein LOC130992793 [Salvia miltiorrhiza]
MAASSPVKSSSGATDVSAPPSSKSLRGLNKPKCIKCGNVARSRCPYQSCKNCCAKAQNPCHIHVLKGNSSFPDKPPSTSSPLFDQQLSEASHSGSFNRLRQLSNNFAQFSNLQTSFRSRKPLTKKDAQVINEWRFSKLKEFRDGNIESESEAFDRYMQNVGLLEEVFRVSSEFDEQNNERMVHELKLKLRSNPATTDNLRKRIQYIVDQGLKKVGKPDDASDTEGEGGTTKKIKSLQGEKATALVDLNDKLNKARNEDELKACWEMVSQVFQWNTKKSDEEAAGESACRENDDSSTKQESHFFPPKWVNPVTIDQQALCQIDAQFSSLEEVHNL